MDDILSTEYMKCIGVVVSTVSLEFFSTARLPKRGNVLDVLRMSQFFHLKQNLLSLSPSPASCSGTRLRVACKAPAMTWTSFKFFRCIRTKITNAAAITLHARPTRPDASERLTTFSLYKIET
nr:uncharacterized protein LOC128690809 isoform X1 [Cherax quadricarinatus]XP_053635509.1 uncharacterized protein LOC128690809 isoform X2 [Cherax quadricarinatus]